MEPPAAGQSQNNGFSESVESSPRSRTTDSWEDHPPAPARVRLMCSYGGHIVPRPHDKSLCYVGGETRIVVADRGSSLGDLRARLSKSLLGGGGFALKYQLPSEDLDSLISVTTDEDLDNMLDEYDRSRPNRLRLFLFSSSAAAAANDDDWFAAALNAAGGSSNAATASVNCLLGLDDDDDGALISAAPEPPPQQRRNLPFPTSQEVQSVPDSPMLETTSSFGSASSSNLPPIRLHADSSAPPPIEDQFSRITVSNNNNIDAAGFIALSSPPADFDDRSIRSAAVLDLPSHDSVSSESSLGRAKPQIHEPIVQIPINNNISDPNSVYVLPQPPPPPQPQYIQQHSHHSPAAAYYQPVYTSQQFPVYYIPATPQQQQQQQSHYYANQSDASAVQVQRINSAPQQHYIGYSHQQPVYGHQPQQLYYAPMRPSGK